MTRHYRHIRAWQRCLSLSNATVGDSERCSAPDCTALPLAWGLRAARVWGSWAGVARRSSSRRSPTRGSASPRSEDVCLGRDTDGERRHSPHRSRRATPTERASDRRRGEGHRSTTRERAIVPPFFTTHSAAASDNTFKAFPNRFLFPAAPPHPVRAKPPKYSFLTPR